MDTLRQPVPNLPIKLVDQVIKISHNINETHRPELCSMENKHLFLVSHWSMLNSDLLDRKVTKHHYPFSYPHRPLHLINFNAVHTQPFQSNLFDRYESMVFFYKNSSYFESKNQSEETGNFVVWWSKSIYIGAEDFHHSSESECRLLSLLYQQIPEKLPFFMNK